ncbi:MAG: hypothetical protein ABIJ46_01415 [bacterium]
MAKKEEKKRKPKSAAGELKASRPKRPRGKKKPEPRTGKKKRAEKPDLILPTEENAPTEEPTELTAAEIPAAISPEPDGPSDDADEDEDDGETLPPDLIGQITPAEGAEIEKELTDIYFDAGSDDDPDMSRLERVRHSTPKKILIGLLIFTAVVASVAWIGLLMFGRTGPGFTGEQVILSIDAPDQIESGQDMSFTVRYKNTSDVPLGTAVLELRLPNGFETTSSVPSLEEGNIYRIGSLPPWGEGEMEVNGSLLSPLDRQHDIQAIITYRPANFSSEFQKVTTRGVTVSGSVLEIEAAGPERALPGDRTELTFSYRNGSERRIDNAAIRVSYPPEFIPESAEPSASDDTMTEWRLGTAEPFGTGSVKVVGTFASEAHGGLTVTAAAGYTDPNENFVPQSETPMTVEVLQGELVAAMVLNGHGDDQAVRLGDRLRYSVSYRNTGEASLGNVKLSVQLKSTPEGGLISWNDLEDEADGQLRDGRITWTSKQIPSLARIEAGEEGVIEFSVPLSAQPPSESGSWSVSGWVETEVKSIDGDVVNKLAKSQPITAKMLSDTALTASARFYDDEGVPVGSGLLPPEVGQPTTYRVAWTLTNSFHDLTDLKLSASLPENVTWTGSSQASAGEVSYDAAERKLTWRLNWLPKTVGQVTVWFDVTIVPTEAQRDRVPTLVDASVLEATDRDIDEKFTLSQPPLTTSLADDAYGAGKGRVQ